MPTRLGNVIAAFEHYAKEDYGMSSVTLWPRLLAKVDPVYASLVENSKIAFDLVLNLSFLLAVLALEYVYVGLWLKLWWPLLPRLAFVLIAAGGLGLLSCLCYQAAINRAVAWGNTVKGAFDLYRWDLLAQLGYRSQPKTPNQERRLWRMISNRMMTGAPEHVTMEPYERVPEARTRVESKPKDIDFEITKGAECVSLKDNVVRYVVEVKNVDEKGRKANSVKIVDTLPEGFEYRWGSAAVTTNAITSTTGTNPYIWMLSASVEAGSTVRLTYEALLRPAVESNEPSPQ